MRQYLVQKTNLQGEIHIPPSKSHTLRAILFGTLAKGKTVIHNYLASTDTAAMIEASRLLGAKVEVFNSHLEIKGTNGRVTCTEDVINAANSGIVLRFCAAVGALAGHPVVITGDHSIRHHRPMQPLLDGLCQLGASAKTMRGDGFAPVIIQGPIKPGIAVIDGADSQPVSALLIAGAFVDGTIELQVRNPGEKAWVALTLDWLKRLGIACENQDFTHYRLFGNARYDGFEYTVPGDFSSAAFPIAAALVTQSELAIKNIDVRDVQGDKELIGVFQQMGANIEIDERNKCLYVRTGNPLHGVSIDINNFVDAVTILAVVACFAEGETHIKNAAVARQKECDRIQCMAAELRKMGAWVNETADGLIVKKSSLTGAKLDSYQDHRMAMSLAVAAMGAQGKTAIAPVECVAKTFPSFVCDFQALGANIEEKG